MLSEADKLRARFTENDSVSFGVRPPREGIIVRINRSTATVRCQDGPQEYRVPFSRLRQLTPATETCAEARLTAASRMAQDLMETHRLRRWTFRFDHSIRRAGCCSYSRKVISISSHLARNTGAEEIRDTLLHEIAHALVGPKHHHDAVWKAKALEIGGTGQRCHQLTFSTPRYRVTCENNCWSRTAERRNPRLICRSCGGKLIYTAYRNP